MKKTLVFIALNCLLCATAAVAAVSAQTRARVFDNFETSRGVEVVAPKAVTLAPEKKLVKKTAEVKPVAAAKTASKLKIQPPPQYVPTTRLMMSKGTSLDNFTTGDAKIDSYIIEACLRYNIDPLLIYAQMHQESSFKLKATSYKGARGLMQLMPATAVRFGVTNIYEPKQNIEAGVRYMRWLLNTFNQDVTLALAGYNAGEGAVMKYGWQVPPYNETREYVRRIGARYNAIRNPYAVKPAVKVTTHQVAKLEKKAPAPLTVYEPDALTVRLPDGRMRLVNQ